MDEQENVSNKSWPQWLSTLSACFGMFCAGMCFAWSSPSLIILQQPDSHIQITSDEASWIASLMQFGSAFSPFAALFVSKYMGPKVCVLMSAVPYLVGFLLIVVAESVVELYAARFICGIGVGMSFLATPIYIVEVAENHNRGALMIVFSIVMSIASLSVSAVGPYLSIKTMGEIMIIFPLLLLATFSFAPDSPYYYVRTKNDEKALKSLKMLRRQPNEKILQQELETIQKHTQNNVKIINCFKEFLRMPNPKALSLVFLTIVCQQCSGAVTTIIYMESLYKEARVPIDTNIAVLITLVIANISGFIAMKFTDIWGRKPLLIVSAVGCIITNAMLGTYFEEIKENNDIPNLFILPTLAIVLMQVFFNLGLNPIPYTLAGEVFSSNSKEIALCFVSVGGALVGFSISKLYQVVNDSLGGGAVFFGLMIITFILLLNIIWFIPETKGKGFQEIQDILKGTSDKYENKTNVETNDTTPAIKTIYNL